MKQRTFPFLLVLLIGMNVSQAFAQANVKADEKTTAYLAKFRSNYVKSLLEQKPERIAGYYAQDIRLMPEFQQTVMGNSNALTYYKAFLSRFTIREYTRNEIEILDLGASVVELGTFTMKMKLKSSGQVYELQGKYQTIWEKPDSGKLSLITEAWNYNHPVEMTQQLKFAEVPAVHVACQAHLPINCPIRFELAALNRLMETTITQHDVNLWSQFLTDDGMFIYSNHPIYQGRKAIDAFLAEHAKELPVFEKLDCRNDRVDDLGNYVIEYASHIAIVRNGEWSGVNTGKDIRIWRREPGGSLKIFRQIAMYD